MKELSKIEEILLVAIWRLKDQAYGVRIRRHVSRVLGKDITYGNLYSALHQLTAKKFVLQADGPPGVSSRRGRPRIYYTVSPAGLEALQNARELNRKLWLGLTALALNKD
ncbi:MAG: helix-turn-helix transcriptional regulator [Candidatus Aminicenantes bacterium]|nr:helix-turn-helix transcriptional regulator [Candidatus Aminicenantes bacterium]